MNDYTRATTTAAVLHQLPGLLEMIATASQLAGANAAVPKYLTMTAALLRNASVAYHELVALKGLVTVMVRENREPFPDEWEALQVRSDIAHGRIQSYDVDAEAEK